MSPQFSIRLLVLASLLLAGSSVPARGQEIVVDNTDAGFSVVSTSWNTSTIGIGYYGSNYRFRSSNTVGEVRWVAPIAAAGNYEVAVYYPAAVNHVTNAPYTVNHSGGTQTFTVNQQQNGGQWVMLGTVPFSSGATADVRLRNVASTTLRTVADAVRFTFVSELPPPSPEFRGMWVTRFEWPSTNLATVQNTITTVMDRLQQHNFNAAIFQVRGQMDTLYPSPEEPWSPILSSNGNAPSGWGNFDPMQYAIDAAHARGLEFHAYINTHVSWQSSAGLPPNYSAAHPFWQYTNAADPNKRAWLIHDENAQPVQFSESSYAWIAPGVPDAQAWTRRQVMYVVENYDVDGVHFDRIRTPGNNPANKWSHDPISEARFAGEGNPHNLNWADWTRDQITRQLQDLYAQIMEVKPHLKVSSAPLGLYHPSRYVQYGYPQSNCGFQYGQTCTYQDAQAWLAAGAQDFIVPQIYWPDEPWRMTNPHFSQILPDWLANRAGRHIYAGQTTGVGHTSEALIHEVNVTRNPDMNGNTGQGNVIFSYSGINNNNWWSAYSGPGGPYQQPAAIPEMPWKDNPTHGIIIGNVAGLDNVTPVVDCHITRTGSSYVTLSSGDGLYSFLLVDPGTYTLTFDKLGLGTRQVSGVEVVAGEVTRVDVSYGIGAPPLILQHPEPENVCPETTVSFAVAASGTGVLSYQWQKDEANLNNGGSISGADTPELQIADVNPDDAGPYRCVVSNESGSTPSEAAALSVRASTGISQHPEPVAVTLSSPAGFTVMAAGEGSLSYQWQRNGSDLSDGGDISGATTATLQIEHVHLGHLGGYRCLVTAQCGSVLSDEADLTFSHAPGDFDLDGDVEQEDFGYFQLCYSGEAVQEDPACRNADFNGDGFVNGQDFDVFVKCASGPETAADVSCVD